MEMIQFVTLNDPTTDETIPRLEKIPSAATVGSLVMFASEPLRNLAKLNLISTIVSVSTWGLQWLCGK